VECSGGGQLKMSGDTADAAAAADNDAGGNGSSKTVFHFFTF